MDANEPETLEGQMSIEEILPNSNEPHEVAAAGWSEGRDVMRNVSTRDSTADGAKIAASVLEHLGPPAAWISWPGGYPDRPDLALVDAVMSIRARYGTTRPDGPVTGVTGAVARYREHAGDAGPDWMSHLAGQDPRGLEEVVGRSVTGGRRKAEAIVDAARRFNDAGVFSALPFNPEDEDQRRLYTGVQGLGPVTWDYFCMLLGHPGVKPDTWIGRFVEAAIGQTLTPSEAGAAVKAAAAQLGANPSQLDHAIWDYARRTRLASLNGTES